MSRGLNAKHEVFFHLRSGTNTRVQGADGSSWRRRRRGYGRLEVRPRLWTERGGRGDPTCVLTSGRDGRRWPNLGRRREDNGGNMRLGLLARGCAFQRPSVGHTHGRAESSGRASHGGWPERDTGKKRKQGLDGNDIQTRTGTTKWKGNDEANAMVCSASAKDERRRWKSSSELRRSRRSWGRWRSRHRNWAIHHTTTLSSTRETPGWCPFAPEVHGFAGKARRKFAGI
jgi:hypothetical protein